MYELILELVGKDMRWEFAQREIRVGRDPNCDLVLPTDEYPMVSRSHLMIRLAADQYWIEDLNTTGGTFVNGEQVQVNPLSTGDVIRLGTNGPELRANIVASYRLEGSESPPRRQSASDVASTGLKWGPAALESQEAPTGEKAMIGSRSAEEVPLLELFGEQPGESGVPPAVAPATPEKEAPSVTVSAARGHDQASPASAFPVAASEPARAESMQRKGGPRKIPPEPSASGDANLAGKGKRAPRDVASMEQELRTIRILIIMILMLVVVLGGMFLYHIWRG